MDYRSSKCGSIPGSWYRTVNVKETRIIYVFYITEKKWNCYILGSAFLDNQLVQIKVQLIKNNLQFFLVKQWQNYMLLTTKSSTWNIGEVEKKSIYLTIVSSKYIVTQSYWTPNATTINLCKVYRFIDHHETLVPSISTVCSMYHYYSTRDREKYK